MAALLEMNTSPAESEPALQVKTPMRFTYASGSRPLEGYTIKRGVGRGGFGEVYFAVSDAGKEVALKLIRRNLEVELRGVTHCLNLKHPNLVALYDIRTDEHEDRWVVMEYVSGESLEEMIDRYPEGMPRDVLLHWFEGICAGVAYLHDHGIVHRDLKPANIFVDDGIIKIGDYGLSKFISCSRRSGQTESVGTVHYMAPEIANGRYGREIDAYALGIILYEMLTGRVPFEGESVGEVLMKHLTAEPNLDLLGEPYRTVVRGAMAKDPERRINSATEMITLLRGADAPSPRPAFAAAPQSFAPTPTAAPANPAKSSSSPIQGMIAMFHRDPEPIWDSIRTGWLSLRKDLNYDRWSVTGRIAFAFIGLMAFVSLAPVWFPTILAFVIPYAGYRIVRIIVRATTTDPHGGVDVRGAALPVQALSPQPAGAARTENHSAAVMPVAHSVATSSPVRRRGQSSWRHAAHQELLSRTIRDRTSNVFGSMLAAGIVAPVAALLACMFLTPELPLELLIWTSIIATLASWALMIPGQVAEARVEDHAPLRFLNLLLGAGVGLAAWALAELLFLKLPASSDFGPGPTDSLFGEIFRSRYEGADAGYHSGAVQMAPAMFAAYFAFFFVLLRWWRLAESTRSTRVSLWSTAFAGFIGWGLTFFWWFPQPMGLLLAAVIAFTVQLSSPWISPSRRRELAQKIA